MLLLHALFYAHSNADLETLVAVDRGAQQDRVVGGSVRVAEAMAAALGERVVLGRPVRRVQHDGNGVRVIARDGSEYYGDAAVVTLPPTLAGRLEYDPPLPSWRDQLTRGAPQPCRAAGGGNRLLRSLLRPGGGTPRAVHQA